jgi:hypothetical protein
LPRKAACISVPWAPTGILKAKLAPKRCQSNDDRAAKQHCQKPPRLNIGRRSSIRGRKQERGKSNPKSELVQVSHELRAQEADASEANPQTNEQYQRGEGFNDEHGSRRQGDW